MLVLVADKDPYDLDLAISALRAPDVDVVCARDGEEVMRLAKEQLPEIVVVASSLGQMGGFAISRDLKTMSAAGEIPEPRILVLLERDADSWLAAWSQCDAWRTKPVEAGELEVIVRELAGRGEPVAT